MKPRSAIAKGKLLEDYVASQIREHGLDPKATRSHGSGNTNTEKSDIWTSMEILGQNVGIECKNQKKIAIQNWWEQTQKLERLGREPVLAFKFDRESFEETKVVIYLDTFLKLAQGSSNSPLSIDSTFTDPKKKYAVQNAIQSLKTLLKQFDI